MEIRLKFCSINTAGRDPSYKFARGRGSDLVVVLG